MNNINLRHQNVTNAASVHSSEKQQDFYQKIIAFSAFVGGIFLLLASAEVLPNFPNAISRMEIWGEVIGSVLTIISGIYLYRVCNDSHSSVQQQELHHDTQRVLAVGQQQVQTLQGGLNLLVGQPPKRKSDGQDLQPHLVDCQMQASSLKIQLSYIDLFLKHRPRNANQLAYLLDEHNSVESAISDCIAKFIQLAEKGRSNISPIDPNLVDPRIRQYAELVHQHNTSAQTLNEDIENLRISLCEKLARIYPSLDSPPHEFVTISHPIMRELSQHWQSLIQSVTNTNPPN